MDSTANAINRLMGGWYNLSNWNGESLWQAWRPGYIDAR